MDVSRAIFSFILILVFSFAALGYIGRKTDSMRRIIPFPIILALAGFVVFRYTNPALAGPWCYFISADFFASFFFGWLLHKTITGKKKKKKPVQAMFVVLLFVTSGLLFVGCFQKVESPKQNIRQELKTAQLGDFVILDSAVICLVKSHDNQGNAVIESPILERPISVSEWWAKRVTRVVPRRSRDWPNVAYKYLAYGGFPLNGAQ